MKVYQITLQAFDFYDYGAEEVKNILEEALHNISNVTINVRSMEEREIGVWTDDHPLNRRETKEWEWRRLFGGQS